MIPRALASREVAHADLSELLVVGTMHERKAKMASLSRGFIALPGGYGTLEELSEVVTWVQLGIHQKPLALLDVSGFCPISHYSIILRAKDSSVRRSESS